MSTITLTEVRRKLSGIVRSVNEDERKEPVFITVRGQTRADILSVDEYDRMSRQSLDEDIDAIFKELATVLQNMDDYVNMCSL